MIYTKSITKSILLLVVLAVTVFGTSRAQATPLYGGYNGDSTAWVEYNITGFNALLFSANVFFGVDIDDHRWVKFRISLAPTIVRMDITYDSADILSLNLSTLLPWPILIGREIDIYDEGNTLWWFMAYLVSGVGGVDSEDTRWGETGIPGVYGSGSDSKDNQWVWVKIVNWLFGIGEDFTTTAGDFLSKESLHDFQTGLTPLHNHFSQAYGDKIRILLEKLTARDLMHDMIRCADEFAERGALLAASPYSRSGPSKNAVLSEMQSQLDALGATIAEEFFTEEVKGELHQLLENFAQDVQPPLKKITETMTSP